MPLSLRPQPLSRTSCSPLPLPHLLPPPHPLPFSASSPACISILLWTSLPPRSHLAGVGRPRHLLLSAGLGPSSRETPAFMPEEERREETRRGEGVGRKAGRSARPREGGFSGQDKGCFPEGRFLPVSPADPATRGVCSALVGRGPRTGLGEAGVFWVLCTPLTSSPPARGTRATCFRVCGASLLATHREISSVRAGGRRARGWGGHVLLTPESPARGVQPGGLSWRARRLLPRVLTQEGASASSGWRPRSLHPPGQRTPPLPSKEPLDPQCRSTRVSLWQPLKRPQNRTNVAG